MRMCAVLRVSRSGYYEWRERPASPRAAHDQVLLTHIWRVHLQSRQCYGAHKTWLELNDQGIVCGKHQVARLRKCAGIEARRKRRFRLTVENHATAPAAPNLVQRRFQVEHPNRVWVGDMTFIRTRAGFLYLAVLLDLYARRVVGWSMSERPDLALVLGALTMALENHRRPKHGLDTSHRPRIDLRRAHLPRDDARTWRPTSMSAKGSAYDNAVA